MRSNVTAIWKEIGLDNTGGKSLKLERLSEPGPARQNPPPARLQVASLAAAHRTLDAPLMLSTKGPHQVALFGVRPHRSSSPLQLPASQHTKPTGRDSETWAHWRLRRHEEARPLPLQATPSDRRSADLKKSSDFPHHLRHQLPRQTPVGSTPTTPACITSNIGWRLA